jgi:hypothetical protein
MRRPNDPNPVFHGEPLDFSFYFVEFFLLGVSLIVFGLACYYVHQFSKEFEYFSKFTKIFRVSLLLLLIGTNSTQNRKKVDQKIQRRLSIMSWELFGLNFDCIFCRKCFGICIGFTLNASRRKLSVSFYCRHCKRFFTPTNLSGNYRIMVRHL